MPERAAVRGRGGTNQRGGGREGRRRRGRGRPPRRGPVLVRFRQGLRFGHIVPRIEGGRALQQRGVRPLPGNARQLVRPRPGLHFDAPVPSPPDRVAAGGSSRDAPDGGQHLLGDASPVRPPLRVRTVLAASEDGHAAAPRVRERVLPLGWRAQIDRRSGLHSEQGRQRHARFGAATEAPRRGGGRGSESSGDRPGVGGHVHSAIYAGEPEPHESRVDEIGGGGDIARPPRPAHSYGRRRREPTGRGRRSGDQRARQGRAALLVPLVEGGWMERRERRRRENESTGREAVGSIGGNSAAKWGSAIAAVIVVLALVSVSEATT
mmetsp:Transcript_29350/g.86971  ORF Transcript_29350/g.86971 Transcript_29350/m.86971 type:complete len:322 (-) Transcript_29350:29-994(-)